MTKYQTAFPAGGEDQADKILDILSQAVGFRCSFAILHGAGWQIMPEGEDGSDFFYPNLARNSGDLYHPTLLDAAHSFLGQWKRR